MKTIAIFLLLFITLSCSIGSSKSANKVIAIQPFGAFDSSSSDSVAQSIKRTFGFEVELLPSRKMPPQAFINVKSPRYRADSIIQLLKREKTDQFDHALGLTASDISTTKRDKFGKVLTPKYKYEDWGVFGLGFRPGESCVVSTFRLKTSDPVLFLERLKKVCNHEIGHNLGLSHCESNEKCVMKDAAESIKTVDFVDLVLCEECASNI